MELKKAAPIAKATPTFEEVESKSLIKTTPIKAIIKKNHCKGSIFSLRKITAYMAANNGAT
jgi:hypothetical protein